MTVTPPARLFCSDAARLRGDSAVATAARIDVWILVEFAGPWGRDPIHDAALSPAVRQKLLQVLKEIPRSRLLFIRRRTGPQQSCRVMIARSNGDPGLAFLDLPSVEDVVDVSITALLETPDLNAPPLVLVCTHGQHDSCCGRRGYPLYDALSQQRGIDVWQCSHVGGDRFAANVVVLPWGIFYGPVEVAQASTLVSSIHASELFLPAYRGRSTISRPAQAAETFLRRTLELTHRDALRVIGRDDLPDGRVVVHLREPEGRRHDVTLEQFVATEAAFATCTSKRTDAIREFRVLAHETR